MAENESPARESSTRGRGRGGRGRGGRGRGGGRGGSTAAVSKAATAKTGRGGSRRGRAKNFADSRVQAAYERQRHLKANYQAVAHALKPALQELADRTIEDALHNPDKHKHAQEFIPVMQELQDNLDAKIAEYKRRFDRDMELAEHLRNADDYVAHQEYQNGLAEVTEQFYEGQENRARILNSLYDKDLPVDVVDDQYEYKVISDEHFDEEFGIYECKLDGVLVPYPSRVPGTAMWQKGRDNEVAATAAVTAATTTTTAAAPAKSTRGRGRGANKRRAQEQPEGQPTPKKNTRSNPDDALASPSLAAPAPAPAKGLLASAAEVEATPEGTPAESDSTPASPEPPAFANGIAPAAAARVHNLRLPAREKSPPLPKNMGEPDEYGFRMFNQKPSMREKGISSRLFVPRPFEFEKWEIGFRDSTNDSSKGHTRAKRGKYLDNPDSHGVYIDMWCNGYDFSTTTPSDFDKEIVRRFGVHPKFGIILRDVPVPEVEKTPHVMPGKPVVYIANPSGRISHASRSFLKTTNHRRIEDSPYRAKIGASVRRFCKLEEVNPDEINISEYVRSEEELRGMSLGTAVKELEARPVVSRAPSESEEPEVEDQVTETEDMTAPQPEVGFTGLSVLALAGAFLEVEEQKSAPASAPAPAPKHARYDAIRDVFTDSKPTPTPKPDNKPSAGLDILAALSDVAGTSNESVSTQEVIPVYGTAGAEYAMSYEPAPVAEAPAIMEAISVQEQPVYRDGVTNGMGPASHGMQEHDHRGSIARTTELPPVTPSQAPIDPRFSSTLVEVPQGYMHQPHAQLPMQPSGSVHGHPGEAMPYPPVHDHSVPQHPSVRHSDYPPPPPSQGPPAQEQGAYLSHNSYSNPDHRDAHMASGRPIDPGYSPRRLSYATDAPSYSRQYWSQPPPPPGPATAPPAPPGPAPGSVSSHYSSPAPPPARIPFSHNGSTEPLPPLRPSRGRNQSLQDEALLEPSLRSSGPYCLPGPPRSYHRGGYPGPEPHGQPPLQPIATDRILPNPQTAGQGFMTSPHQGYAHQVLSPTYANPPPMPPHMAQSPQENHQGLPNSVHRHRSTPSGSSDAGNKYRKLQPAPVPAHRAWPNKPELKTIPYDHKETGSAAALPSSGPTQIRGWSADEQTGPSKPFKSVRFAEPLVGVPATSQKSNKRKRLESQTREGAVEIEPTEEASTKKDNAVLVSNPNDSPPKRQLRPRKPKPAQAQPAASTVEPPRKKTRTAATRKPNTTGSSKATSKKTVKKAVDKSAQPSSSKRTSARATSNATDSKTTSGKPSKGQEPSVKDESSDDVQIIKSQRAVITIESTEESSK